MRAKVFLLLSLCLLLPLNSFALTVKGTAYATDSYGDSNDYLIAVEPMDVIRDEFAVYSDVRIDIW